ncbi:L-serine ammonia-lyase [Terriglobus roseus]|uniref:L-serine dehydratase n=1 Tax=Terriglobus roseus TaxID=392734 RepID=A0A1H4JHM9_9BACT|nr:L-serine ammonia-lyase [Terriglobus roseus]SEB45122.1 L-serine dehydratase [Terriglobus roseus]
MTSLFELFKIGIGPSSSHTVAPMRAALAFLRGLQRGKVFDRVTRVRIDLYGSLALTGIGHGTDSAVLTGLAGETPDTIEPARHQAILKEATGGSLTLNGSRQIAFVRERDLLFHKNQMYPDADLPTHPNGVRFTAFDETGTTLAEEVFYSIGGGFIVTAERFSTSGAATPESSRVIPYPFRSAAELLEVAAANNLTIADLVLANEIAMLADEKILRPRIPMTGDAHTDVRNGILALWAVMADSIERGQRNDGILPGGLSVRRRAPRLTARLGQKPAGDPLGPLDWVTVFAMAVNEENAAGGRVVTSPTNGAAGVVPAVARYYRDFIANADDDGLLRYFLTAAAIGILYKENASISGAEVGCQGEVGVACSMAAGGLVAALGGTNLQVEHAAEIGMEHNLGMTCDPIGGLVQIPCIERNAMGAVKAVNATRMAMNETDEHKVSLDQVIKTMYLTGLDMQSRYKETSLAGLALNIIEC